MTADDEPEFDLPTLGRLSFAADERGGDAIRLMVFLLDYQDAAPSIRRLRDWALAAASAAPGETVVDVGSGTGTMARELAQLVGPEGSVVGVEPNPVLRQIAEDRTTSLPQLRYLDALAGALPFDDDSVDVIWCERVLQHVEDPGAAVAEFARVLRPGGRALILDSDHATRVLSDVDRDAEQAFVTALLGQLPNPRAARELPRQILAVGLELDPDIASSALMMPPDLALRVPWLTAMVAPAVERGLLTQQQADEAQQSYLRAAQAGYATSSVTVFGFCARKRVGSR